MVAKKSKPKSKNKANQQEDVFDERFIAAVNRPQFQRQHKHGENANKVVLDERFASVLTDERFSLQTKDKYGRKKKGRKKTAASELSEFYTVEKPEDESEKKDNSKDEKRLEDQQNSGSEDCSGDSEVDDKQEEAEEDKDPASRIAYLTALSRGQVDLSESSSEDDTSESSEDESDSDGDSLHGKAGVLDPSNKVEDELSITSVPSPYMAVMNMDWSQVRAVDLFAILSSFTPPGSIRRVQVFPSDFGMERMEKEKKYGPTGLWKKHKAMKDQDDDSEGSETGNDINSGDSEGEGSDTEGEGDTPKIKFELDDKVESGFDPEKLRAYEASKLKYYFAVVEFASPEHADVAYKEIDGMELEHSSASIDMRSIDPDQLDSVLANRSLRDEALSVPSNYSAPDFVVNALQQTNVECTWDEGDTERERMLTKYISKEGWQELAEGEGLRNYLASDQSSAEDSDEESVGEGKGAKLRALLGLDGGSGDEAASKKQTIESDQGSDDDDGFGDAEGEMEASFVPGGKISLDEKIRNKLQAKGEEQELTPWEKYQEKRKQKRRERREVNRRNKKGETFEDKPAIESDDRPVMDDDDFFMDETLEEMKKEKKRMQKKNQKKSRDGDGEDEAAGRAPSTKEELALLVAGEEGDEDERDYDMRGLVRMDKLKGKRLKGARKRKQEKLAANVSGGAFKINTKDDRFAALLQGADDRFGIDRTDPNYKDTEAMREILVEQTQQRKARKRQKKEPVAPNVSADASVANAGGAAALSSLVKSLKTKVAKIS